MFIINFLVYIKLVNLFTRGNEWSIKPPADPDPKSRDIGFLDAYAIERWECVLHFMVGSRQHDAISSDALQLLHHAGLMKKYPNTRVKLINILLAAYSYRENGDSQMTITRDGFQFLLMDTSSQVWYFLLQYLDTATARNLDLVECLGFLFQLSFSTLGQVF